MNKVYEIEYELYGLTDCNYIIARNVKQVMEWLNKNAVGNVIKLQELGVCIKMLGNTGEENE